MKKDELARELTDNSFGIVGVVFGILSIIFASAPGIVLGVVGLAFSIKQKKVRANKWAKSGFILSVIGIVVSVVIVTLLVVFGEAIGAQLGGAA